MTADRFEMEPHNTHFGVEIIETEWTVSFADGDVKVEFDVYDEYIQEVVKDNFDYFTDTLKHEPLCRIDTAWDKDLITDEERDTFARILGKVVG